MVVGVDWAVVVFARAGVDAVVDEAVAVYDAAVPDEVPFLVRPVLVVLFLAIAYAVGEMSGYGEEEFVGDGGYACAGFAPVDAAAGRVVSAGHFLEQAFGGIQILGVACEIVGGDPALGPPTHVIVIIVFPIGVADLVP